MIVWVERRVRNVRIAGFLAEINKKVQEKNQLELVGFTYTKFLTL